jgi:hypothetical protein
LTRSDRLIAAIAFPLAAGRSSAKATERRTKKKAKLSNAPRLPLTIADTGFAKKSSAEARARTRLAVRRQTIRASSAAVAASTTTRNTATAWLSVQPARLAPDSNQRTPAQRGE